MRDITKQYSKIISGKVKESTENIEKRVDKTGGWRKIIKNDKVYLWNPCVSPPFSDEKYDIEDGINLVDIMREEIE